MDQKTVKIRMISVIDQDLIILFERGRYVFGHTTSDGAGASLANSRIGSGSIIAWTAICCHMLADQIDWGPNRRLTQAAVESSVTKASGVGLKSFLRVDFILSSTFRSFSS